MAEIWEIAFGKLYTVYLECTFCQAEGLRDIINGLVPHILQPPIPRETPRQIL